MIQDLDKIKTLLATYEQTESTLGVLDENGLCLYCIEGIFALTSNLAEHVDIASKIIYFSNPVTNEVYESELDYEDFPAGVPDVVDIDFLLSNKNKLQLNEKQANKLQKDLDNKRYSISWLDLNDHVRLTFPQFSLLLNAINNKQLYY